MPPPDYAIARKLVPQGGIAEAPMTPEERAYLDRMKAQAEPWSSYLGAGVSNLLNTAQGFLPTALGGRGDIGASDIVVGAAQGAADTAVNTKRMMTGEIPLFLADGTPNPEAVGTSFDAVGYMTGASAAAPSPDDAIRAGAKVRVRKTKAPNPLDDLEMVRTTVADAKKRGALMADFLYKNLPDDAEVTIWRADPARVNNVSGDWRAYPVNPASKKELAEELETYYQEFMEQDLDADHQLPLDLRRDDLHRLFGKRQPRPTNPEEAARLDEFVQIRMNRLKQQLVEAEETIAVYGRESPEGRRALQVAQDAEAGLENYLQQRYTLLGITDKQPNAPSSTTLNSGLGGFLQRGMQMLRSPEGKGGGGIPAAHPSNPAGSKRAAEVRDGFFLKSEELMWKNPQKNGTAEQFLGYLKKAGVKDREIEALGLDKLTGPITKEELIDHIRRKDPAIMEMKSDAFSNHTVPYENTDDYMMSNYVALNMPGTLFTHAGHGLPDNTLFHNRYTVRQDGNKRVLNVEESQSDWAQTYRGRFRGTKASPDRIETLQVTWDELNNARLNKDGAREDLLELDRVNQDTLLKSMLNADPNEVMTIASVKGVHKPKWFVAGKGTITPEKIFEDSAKRMAPDIAQNGAQAKYRTHVDRMFVDEKFGNVGAPYVSSGSAGIVPLALKQAILKAIEVGADEITFTPGAIHAERWGGTDKRKAKGLTEYYDKVFVKEAKSALKEIGKDAGMDLQFKVEQKPWMVSEYFRSQNPRVYGNPQQNFGDWTYDTPSIERARFYGFDPDNPDQLAKSHYIDRVLNEVNNELVMEGNNNFPGEQHFERYEQGLREELKTYSFLVENSQKRVDASAKRLENKKARNAPQDELDNESQVLENAKADLEDNQNMVSIVFDRLALIPEAKRVVEKWKNEIMGSEPPPKLNEGIPAMVLELTPELKEYIKKNGLPKFAKGGIVDLALLGAAHA